VFGARDNQVAACGSCEFGPENLHEKIKLGMICVRICEW
jgi:hypothetical protein